MLVAEKKIHCNTFEIKLELEEVKSWRISLDTMS